MLSSSCVTPISTLGTSSRPRAARFIKTSTAAPWEGRYGDKVVFFSDYQALAKRRVSIPGLFLFLPRLLSQKLGYGVTPGESYYPSGCSSTTKCVSPNATIPERAWSSPAQKLLPYIPLPNQAAAPFPRPPTIRFLNDNKGGARVDANTRVGMLSAYYFLDKYTLDNPYPVVQGGACLPGFWGKLG